MWGTEKNKTIYFAYFRTCVFVGKGLVKKENTTPASGGVVKETGQNKKVILTTSAPGCLEIMEKQNNSFCILQQAEVR